jgi:glycosyltransferase involved in cell wall biosynthesis
VVFHQHEFAELEREDSRIWRLLVSPALRYLLARYTSDPEVRIDQSITVCNPIAERYERELNIRPLVVYNAPTPLDLAEHSASTSASTIRLIHHGYAQRSRGIDCLIEAIALADKRFTLDLMLMGDDPRYVRSLVRLAAKVAPGRVFFRDPVRPHEIVRIVADYDIGLCVIQPRTYNTLMMLPNKLFEYIQAGLAVCVGPSPAMMEIALQYGLGVCSPSFEPAAVAATLNKLTVQDIHRMRAAARRAAATLNADVEMKRVVDVYHNIFRESEARVA